MNMPIPAEEDDTDNFSTGSLKKEKFSRKT